MNEVAKKCWRNQKLRLEKFGKTITFLCMSLIVVVVAMILIFVAQKGLSTFFVNKVNIFSFLFGSTWNPAAKEFGALTNDSRFLYCNLAFCPLGNAVCHWCSSFMTEVSPKGARFLQPAIELLVGIPSVVYGFIGLQVVVPFTRSLFGGTGFGILSGVFVLFVMILPTVTFMTTDSSELCPVITGKLVWPWVRPAGKPFGMSLSRQPALESLQRSSLEWRVPSGKLGYPDGGRKLCSGANLAHNTSFHPHLYFDHGNRKYRHGYGQ